MTSSTTFRKHYRACNLCEAICGLEIALDENDAIISIKGDENDPLSRGHICPKAVALKDIYHDPNRLKQPVRRTATGWETITWEDAFTEVVQNIKAVQAQFGKNSVATYFGNPSVHNSGTLLTIPGVLKALGSKNRFSATSADQLPHHFVSSLMFGHPSLLPVPDIDRTDFMLIIGGNPLASNGSMMTVPDVSTRLKAIQKRGGKVVVVDPRRTETAKIADQHIFVRPGTDVFLLLGIVKIILQKPITQSTENTQLLTSILADYSLESIAKITGMSVETIEKLAQEFTDAPSAVAYGRMGVSVQAYGGVCQWLVNMINILSNNFDKAGGAMFTQPAFDLVGTKNKQHIYNRWQSSVRGLPEFDSEIPVSALGEEILQGEVKSMVTLCGNPVLSTPNGQQLDTAFESLKFMVSIDIYINETTRHANIILPPTTGLEVAHYDLAFHNLAVRNTARYSEPLYEKDNSQRHDWEILQELSNRLVANEGEPIPAAQDPEMKIDFMLKNGLYGKEGMSVQQLKDNPHGVDLGELNPCLNSKIRTDNQTINLLPDLILNDLNRVKKQYNQLSATPDLDLLLIGRRHLRSNNSWMHNSERLVKGRERCTLMIHPETAQRLGLGNHEKVQVQSRVGQVEIATEITDEIMPNVVSIPHGYGHARKGVQLDIATQHSGVSINDLTDDSMVDELTGNAVFSGVPVKVFRG
jgi:anaerobic selenocysteine-containing dehydrogenase